MAGRNTPAGRPKRKDSMKGMSVKSGDLRRTSAGAGMSQGIKKYRQRNPDQNYTVTESKPKPRLEQRRKSYCARSAGQMKTVS